MIRPVQRSPDNLEATPIDGLTCLVEVGRFYGLDWDRFDDGHRRALARVCEGLPGTMRQLDVPWWFGDDEDVPPLLWASVEPGLQVHGVLPEADWRAWDERFRREAAGCRARLCVESPASPDGDDFKVPGGSSLAVTGRTPP
jgi:hypothetical protein